MTPESAVPLIILNLHSQNVPISAATRGDHGDQPGLLPQEVLHRLEVQAPHTGRMAAERPVAPNLVEG